MPHIAIIAASVRTGRLSNRVALFLKKYIEDKNIATTEILDLQQYQFPVFDERLKYQSNPSPAVLDFASRIKNADGVIIVTPEYNGGYPASIKNVVDLLYDEWHRKPVAISTVSDGSFGGTQVITSLQFSLWKIRAWTVPAMFPVPVAQKTFDENGVPAEPATVEKRASNFVNELMWCIRANEKMKNG
jgi:NAD(P)H-dependent FMN reductase